MDTLNRPSERPARVGRASDRMRRMRRGAVLSPTAAMWTAYLGVLIAAFSSLPPQTLHAADAKPQAVSAAPPAVLPSESTAAIPIEKSPAKDKSAPAGRQLLREGYELRDQLGTFRAVGGRLLFALDKRPARLVALENLNLERIARVMAENPAAVEWRINGVVSEYRGVNYVMIERAVLRNTAAEPPTSTPPSAPPAKSPVDNKPQGTASHE